MRFDYEWWQTYSFTIYEMNKPIVFDRKFKYIVKNQYLITDVKKSDNQLRFKLYLQTYIGSGISKRITRSGIKTKFTDASVVSEYNILILNDRYLLVHNLNEKHQEVFELFFERIIGVKLKVVTLNKKELLKNIKNIANFDNIYVYDDKEKLPVKSTRQIDLLYKEIMKKTEDDFLTKDALCMYANFDYDSSYINVEIKPHYNSISIWRLRAVEDVLKFLNLPTEKPVAETSLA